MASQSSKLPADQSELVADPQAEAPVNGMTSEDEDDIQASRQALAEPGQRIAVDAMRQELGL
ncbi:MAG TPA: hypothetical protein VJ783_18305 [Pirellulales bacterium]|nr:hypothetical protein [Pirellulales bacterium]